MYLQVKLFLNAFELYQLTGVFRTVPYRKRLDRLKRNKTSCKIQISNRQKDLLLDFELKIISI